jgi:hypothetical protein
MSDDWHDEQRFAAFPLDPYTEIGVARDASQDELRKKYLDESKKRHPDSLENRDRSSDPAVDLSEPMKRLNEAYDTLSSPDKRARYDRWWDRTNRQPPPGAPGPAGSPPWTEAGTQQAPFVADPWADSTAYPGYPPPDPAPAHAAPADAPEGPWGYEAPPAVRTRRNRMQAGDWASAGCCLAPAVAVVSGPILVAASGVPTTGENFVVAISGCWFLVMAWLYTLGSLKGSTRNADGTRNRVQDAKLGCCMAPISIAAGVVIVVVAPIHVTAWGFAAMVGALWVVIMAALHGLRSLSRT